VLETATPRLQALNELKDELEIIRIRISLEDGRQSNGSERIVLDKDFASKVLDAKYKTEVINGSFAEEIAKQVSLLEKPLLIACNTIDESLEAYEKLKRSFDNVYVLHSQFTVNDRKGKLWKIKRLLEQGRDLIVVATQVIEVGVNLDFASIITNAAPLASLAQRIGRVNRELCEREQKVVVVYDEKFAKQNSYSGVYKLELTQRTIEELNKIKQKGKEVGWRMSVVEESLERDGRKIITLTGLSNSIYGNEIFSIDEDYEGSLRELLNPLIGSKEAIEFMKRYGSFIRENLLVPVLIPQEGEDYTPGESLELDYGSIVPCEAGKLGLDPRNQNMKKAERILKVSDNYLLGIVETEPSEYTVTKLALQDLIEGLITGVVHDQKPTFFCALIGKREAYSSERGLEVL
jgi:superfamily II DNA or RNA helicase